MKKNFLFLLLLLPLGVFAKPYTHSLGVSMGNSSGLSYKTLVTEHFAVQTDVGFHITVFDYVYGSFTINPMLMYQGTMKSTTIADCDFFIGAGPSMGFSSTQMGYNPPMGGEFGLNTIIGFEFAFSRALALSFDFRPGYGMYYGDVEGYRYSSYSSSYYSYSDFGVLHYFDWGVNLGLRFYL